MEEKFCDRYTKKMSKEHENVKKTVKIFLKLLHNKLKTATKEEKQEIHRGIKNINKGFRKLNNNKTQKKMYNDICKKIFFNPGCKGTILENNPKLVKDFYIKSNADYLRKEGAKSGCNVVPFYL